MPKKRLLLIGLVFVFAIISYSQTVGEKLALTGSGETPGTQTPLETRADFQEEPKDDEFKIVTLLPRDGIPAIDHPEFISAEEADNEYEPSELIIGVNYDGDARAYSIPLLSKHEIVNDTVGGRKISVTW